MPPAIDRPSWKVRRTVVIATIIFCASMTVYLAVWGTPDELRETIANGVLFLAGSVIMGYIFGVVWNDKSFYGSQRSSGYDEYGGYGGGYGRQQNQPDQYDAFSGVEDQTGEG